MTWACLTVERQFRVEVLKLVTCSSPRGEKRVTNLRTSTWEATSLVAKQNFALGRHGDRKGKTSLNNSPIAGRFIPQTERTYKTGKVLLFYFLGREGKTEKKNPFLVTQKPCLSAGILLVAIL